MKRFAIKGFGAAREVFEEIEANPRVVDASHVRIAIKTFAVSPYDVAFRQGKMSQSIEFPYVLGKDGAGIVTEVGIGVPELKVGDEVIFHALTGSYGEEIVVPGNKVVLKPAEMSFAEAAGLVTPGLTAYNLVTHLLGEAAGEVVAVQGASGAVGSLVVQLLKANGKTVIGTASKRNEELVRNLGVDHFAAYDQVDPGKVFADQADTVIDATKGSRTSESGMKLLKAGGTYIALNDLPTKRTKAGNYVHFGPSRSYQDQEAFEALTALYKAGKLKLTIAEILPFELTSVITAHEKIEGHPNAGKLIIQKEQ